MKTILLCFFTSFTLLLQAQTETAIRNHYTDINKKITESIEQGFEGPLYNNQWVTNKNGKSWPAVGIYTEITDFWYNDDPNHLPAVERNPKKRIIKGKYHKKSITPDDQ